MIASIKSYCENLEKSFSEISPERKILLNALADYILTKQQSNQPVNLVYICTHNSRRSHFGQIWSQVAANYYNIKNIATFSGGTETTAFNINAINAIKRIGFEVHEKSENKNPIYHLIFDKNQKPIECFSKEYTSVKNPQKEFVAIMTCSDAEENCPFIPGSELRIGTTYDDPKQFDHTPLQDFKYDERCKQIALETFYVFFKVSNS